MMIQDIHRSVIQESANSERNNLVHGATALKQLLLLADGMSLIVLADQASAF